MIDYNMINISKTKQEVLYIYTDEYTKIVKQQKRLWGLRCKTYERANQSRLIQIDIGTVSQQLLVLLLTI